MSRRLTFFISSYIFCLDVSHQLQMVVVVVVVEWWYLKISIGVSTWISKLIKEEMGHCICRILLVSASTRSFLDFNSMLILNILHRKPTLPLFLQPMLFDSLSFHHSSSIFCIVFYLSILAFSYLNWFLTSLTLCSWYSWA